MSESKKNIKGNASKIKYLCFCALFTAIVCACTFISVPLPLGYFNLGDAAILLGAWLQGPIGGCISAALGAALADILMGYVFYAPGTAVIKALVALCAYVLYTLFKKLIKKEGLDFVPRLISAIVGESVMVGGYFFYEAVVLGFGMGATASVFGNVLQGICGTVIGAVLCSVLKKALGRSGLFVNEQKKK